MTYCRAKRHPFSPPLDQRGFSLVEVIVVMAILAVLVSVAIPSYTNIRDMARGARAITEIREMEKIVNAFSIDKAGRYPSALNDPDLDPKTIVVNDPWGTPYGYTNIANASALPPQPFAPRKDDMAQPLNTDFDLFSNGADTDSHTSVADAVSQDDIVRSGDGGFVGIVRDYFPPD